MRWGVEGRKEGGPGPLEETRGSLNVLLADAWEVVPGHLRAQPCASEAQGKLRTLGKGGGDELF